MFLKNILLCNLIEILPLWQFSRHLSQKNNRFFAHFRRNFYILVPGALLSGECKNVLSEIENLDRSRHFDTLVTHVRPRKKVQGHFEIGVKFEKMAVFLTGLKQYKIDLFIIFLVFAGVFAPFINFSQTLCFPALYTP